MANNDTPLYNTSILLYILYDTIYIMCSHMVRYILLCK